MGLFKTLKKVAGGIGDVVKRAAPLATFIPGVGPLASAGLGAAGGLLGQLNNKNGSLMGGLGDAALHAGIGYAGHKGIDALTGRLGGGMGTGGGGGGQPGQGGGGGSSIFGPGGLTGGGPAGLLGSLLGGGGGGGLLGGLLSGGALPLGLAGMGMIRDAGAAKKQGELRERAFKMAEEPWNQMAPVRAQAIREFANLGPDKGNPYAV